MRDQPLLKPLRSLQKQTHALRLLSRPPAAGIPIIYKDSEGRYVAEHPDGRVFDIRFRPGETGDRQVEIIRQLAGPVR